MKRHNLYIMFFVAILTLGLTLAGCSSKSDILKEVSGVWQNNKDNGTVEIQLMGDAKSMNIDGQTYSVAVEKVEMDKFQVNLKVKNGSGAHELWTLREIWDDNGSSFKLSLNRGGQSRVLIPKG